MILRVAYSVLSGKAAQDSRSDDEEELDDESEVDEEEYDEADADAYDQEAKGAWAEPVNDDAATNQARTGASQGKGRNRRPAGPARTSAISIPGHGDRKDLLGRIGCDKPA
jgi:acyl-CoA-dependent ceramide synthase